MKDPNGFYAYVPGIQMPPVCECPIHGEVIISLMVGECSFCPICFAEKLKELGVSQVTRKEEKIDEA